MAENKVQFNLKNVHYAVYNGSTYETPVAVPGAVSVSLDAAGDTTKFYADGYIYYTAVANNGYSGSLEMARIPDQMLQDIWGMIKDPTSKVITEKSDVEPKSFALMFQIDGDVDQEYYTFYNVTAQRPAITSETVKESKDPVTRSLDIVCAPDSNYKVFARTTAETPEGTKTAWFNSVT